MCLGRGAKIMELSFIKKGPRAGLNGAENFDPTGIQSPDRSVRIKSLYRLSYPGAYSESIFVCIWLRVTYCVINIYEKKFF